MKGFEWIEERRPEGNCFVCKDTGVQLLLCKHRECPKAYHPQCVGKDESFLEAGKHWTCGWHCCFICRKSSNLQCFCCPNSVCKECIRSAEFIQLRRTKGFCNRCLKLVKCIEEGAHAVSKGCKVDFKETGTYECLFKDYWENVKEQEDLTQKDVHEADSLSRTSEKFLSGAELDQIFEEKRQYTLRDDGMDINFSETTPFLKDEGFRSVKKGNLRRSRSKKRNFRDWGSVELIEFLTSLDKDTREPLKQWDICKIIESYVQANNLLQPNKKKKTVLCDERLHSLFRKKTVKLNKIYNLLEDHFPSNDNEDSDDESLFGSEEDSDSVVGKRLQQTNCDIVERNKTENDSEPPKSCYASMIDMNIKLIYLRRSLVKDFLGTPETFERKVVGCFVRVKRDPKGFDYSPSKVYQLGLVSAVKKVANMYMVGEISTDIVLCVSNIWKDVYISMLSDDDFEEEECEDLRQLVKKDLFKRPTIAELEEKVRSIHEDIMNHWIKREIAILQRQIDRANEKGWHREKCEYIEKRAILQTHAEQERLVKQIPKIIPDIQESVDNPDSQLNFQREGKKTASYEKAIETSSEGKKTSSCDFQEAIEKEAEGKKTASCDGEKAVEEGSRGSEDKALSHCEDVERKADGNGAAIHEKVGKDEEVNEHKPTDMKKSCGDVVVIEIDEDDELPKVIDVDEVEVLGPAKTSGVTHTLEETPEAISEHKEIWYYVDPKGRQQGPFAMASLRYWRAEGFFDDDFRVWKAGESRTNSILLTEALLLTH